MCLKGIVPLTKNHHTSKPNIHSSFSFQEITTAIFLEQLHGSRMSEDFYHIKRLSSSTGSTCWKDMDINDKCRSTLLWRVALCECVMAWQYGRVQILTSCLLVEKENGKVNRAPLKNVLRK